MTGTLTIETMEANGAPVNQAAIECMREQTVLLNL